MASLRLKPGAYTYCGPVVQQMQLRVIDQLQRELGSLRSNPGAPGRKMHPELKTLVGKSIPRKEGQKKQQAPPELLEEVFELNESLDELRDARESGGSAAAMSGLRAKLEAAHHKFESLLVDVDKELSRVSSEWDHSFDSGSDDAAKKKIMERMNEILNRRSYIRNLVNGVRQELAGA